MRDGTSSTCVPRRFMPPSEDRAHMAETAQSVCRAERQRLILVPSLINFAVQQPETSSSYFSAVARGFLCILALGLCLAAAFRIMALPGPFSPFSCYSANFLFTHSSKSYPRKVVGSWGDTKVLMMKVPAAICDMSHRSLREAFWQMRQPAE